MTKYYKRRYYKNDYNDDGIGCLLFITIWLICSIISFIKKNIELILIILITVSLLSLVIMLLVKRKKIKNYFLNSSKIRKINKLKTHSIFYSKILQVNKKYNLVSLNPYFDQYRVFYKSNLETCNIDDYLLMTIDSKYEELKVYKSKYDNLNKEYECYEKEYNQLKQYLSDEEAIKLKIKKDTYYELQNEIYKSLKLENKPEFKVIIYINYSSKKGRVKDRRYKVYDKFDFSQMLNEYFKLKKEKKLNEISSRVERSKMSESMRFNILKRDHYRCQICGATAKDGAKLQVDHIIPVSKGGKTEESNLQTLCSRCNIGKSNKM